MFELRDESSAEILGAFHKFFCFFTLFSLYNVYNIVLVHPTGIVLKLIGSDVPSDPIL